MKNYLKMLLGGAVLVLLVVGLDFFGDRDDRTSEPKYPAGASDKDRAWLLLEHRIKQSDRELVSVEDKGGALTITYRPNTVMTVRGGPSG